MYGDWPLYLGQVLCMPNTYMRRWLWALAARLAAALPSARVLTLEAGTDNRTSPEIFSLLEFTAVFGGPLDWSWPTDEGRTLNGCVVRFAV